MQEMGVTRNAISPPDPISWSEVTELGRNDLISFESHGVSHTAMSALSAEDLEFEMRHSRDVVSEHTGRPCRHLAYPFGSRQSIGMRAAAEAARFYDSATTMSLGHVDLANPWLLPRIPLYPENSTLFARVKILLKCSTIRLEIGPGHERPGIRRRLLFRSRPARLATMFLRFSGGFRQYRAERPRRSTPGCTSEHRRCF